MTAHPTPRQAFRQFQYLTVPLHVRSDFVETAWTDANRRLESRLGER